MRILRQDFALIAVQDHVLTDLKSTYCFCAHMHEMMKYFLPKVAAEGGGQRWRPKVAAMRSVVLGPWRSCMAFVANATGEQPPGKQRTDNIPLSLKAKTTVNRERETSNAANNVNGASEWGHGAPRTRA